MQCFACGLNEYMAKLWEAEEVTSQHCSLSVSFNQRTSAEAEKKPIVTAAEFQRWEEKDMM